MFKDLTGLRFPITKYKLRKGPKFPSSEILWRHTVGAEFQAGLYPSTKQPPFNGPQNSI